MSRLSDDDDLWEAVADPTRRKLVDLLVAHGHATATILTTDMPVSRQAISKHLLILQRVGLIDSHRQGREVRYEVREQRLAEATGALSEVANRWDRRLQTIKQLAEQAHSTGKLASERGQTPAFGRLHMTGAQAEVTIDKPADEVWSLLGDFGNLSWVPNAKSLQLDGDIRTFQLGGSIVKHRLLHHDDTARSYTYALASDVAADLGEVVHAIEATISVVPDGPSASTVTWSSETEKRRGSSDTLGGFFQGILDHVKTQLEHH